MRLHYLPLLVKSGHMLDFFRQEKTGKAASIRESTAMGVLCTVRYEAGVGYTMYRC